ncbi:MAG TPA: hypothetical protein VN380_17960 [Thermoanaerobaculia bacterium]|nr:hypothetical protein [Thermoanaerobaculia bacterium]
MDERARTLMQKLLDLQKEMADTEAQLVAALHPAKTRKRRKRKATAISGNGAVAWDKRGALVEVLRVVVQAQRGEWTRQSVIEKAHVPADRENSAKAALSRMLADGVIENGETPGTYRTKSKGKEVQR